MSTWQPTEQNGRGDFSQRAALMCRAEGGGGEKMGWQGATRRIHVGHGTFAIVHVPNASLLSEIRLAASGSALGLATLIQ